VPASGVLRAVVPRASVSGTSAGVWCPLNQLYVGDTNMSGGGEFGAQYIFDHNQAIGYTTSVPKYTEFIEVAIEQPVFVSLLELGSPRGMGMVVSIKAYNPTAGWTTLYSSSALTTEAAQYTAASRYWSWQPDLCRAHFNVTDLRIEIDTSSVTGVADWNYIDYVRVYGSNELQAAALVSGDTSVVYVPDANANGADSFTYQASDCPGDLFRSSAAGTISFDITPVNDVPAPTPSVFTVAVDIEENVTLVAIDADNPPEAPAANLIFELLSLPTSARLRDANGDAITAPRDLPSATLYVNSSVCGDDSFLFRARDSVLSSPQATLTLTVV